MTSTAKVATARMSLQILLVFMRFTPFIIQRKTLHLTHSSAMITWKTILATALKILPHIRFTSLSVFIIPCGMAYFGINVRKMVLRFSFFRLPPFDWLHCSIRTGFLLKKYAECCLTFSFFRLSPLSDFIVAYGLAYFGINVRKMPLRFSFFRLPPFCLHCSIWTGLLRDKCAECCLAFFFFPITSFLASL